MSEVVCKTLELLAESKDIFSKTIKVTDKACFSYEIQ